MMEHHVRVMRGYLGAVMEAAGIAGPDDIKFETRGDFFTVAGTGVEVALGGSADKPCWIVREVYDIADLRDGGYRTVVETIEECPIQFDAKAAKLAAMRAVSRKIDLALEDAA